MSPLTQAEADSYCRKPKGCTKDYSVTHVMYRIKDPKKSLPFYSEVLGMTLLVKLDFPESKFSLYFMGYVDPVTVPTDDMARRNFAMSTKDNVELHHVWGTEDDPEFKYHTGNTEPLGYGHFGLVVPDVIIACERLEKLGVEFAKKPMEGLMKGLAYIKDPDGYWIEVANPKNCC